jgi:hypothetical protein
VKSIHVVNTDSANTHTFKLFQGGTAASNQVTPTITLPIGGFAVYNDDAWHVYDNTGALVTKIGTSNIIVNTLTAAMGAVTASEFYVTNSNVPVPGGVVKVGMKFKWRIVVTKTGAGTAAPIVKVYVGTNGSLSDTARLTFTSSILQTAAIDTGLFEIEVIVRSIGASGVIQGYCAISHHLAATGFLAQAGDLMQGASAGFDTTPANLQFGISLTPGTSGVWTVVECDSECMALT